MPCPQRRPEVSPRTPPAEVEPLDGIGRKPLHGHIARHWRRTGISELDHAGPHLRRIVLGARLRQLREEQQIGRRQAAAVIRGSESKISRLELGRIGYTVRDVEDLLTLYGITGEPERATLLTLARKANQPPWWQPYRDVVPGWFEPYLSLEQDARVIRAYEPCHIPGLPRTADYARSVISHGHAGTLAAGIGVFVVPFSAGQPGTVGVPFTILRFPGELIPDLVYTEYLTSAAYPETPAEIRYYWHLMNRLATEALSAEDTVRLIQQILSDG